MESELRICSPGDLPSVFVFDGKKFTGVLQFYINSFCEDLVRGINSTVTIYSKNEGMGELIDVSTGQFNGCLGRLQRNDSDMTLREITYPQKAQGISQGALVADSFIEIVSVYGTSQEPPQAAQMISSFASFDKTVWFLCLVTLTAGYLILATGRKMLLQMKGKSKSTSFNASKSRHQRRHYYSYQVAVHMAARGSLFSLLRPSRRILFLVLSLFSLLVPLYFSSMINTELVVADQPETINSYQDVWDHNMSITFTLILDTYVHFKFAPEGTVERKLWDASCRHLGEERVVFRAGESNLGVFGEGLASRSLVFVTESTWATLITNELCSVVVDQDNLDRLAQFFGMRPIKARTGYPFRSHDPKAKTLSKGFIFREDRESLLLRRVRKVLQRMFEGGLIEKLIKAAERMSLLKSVIGLPPPVDSSHLVDLCEHNVLVLPEMHVQAISLINMSSLAIVILSLEFAAFIVLIMEYCYVN